MAKKQTPHTQSSRGEKKGAGLKKGPAAAKSGNHPTKAPSKRIARTVRESLPVEQGRSEEKGFLIVGVGASAGGLEAFTKLLEHFPPDTGMAFVLVQHLAPTKDSLLSDLLSKTTTMPVCEVQNGMVVEPNHVYVIPPNTVMAIFHGTLRLQPRSEPYTQHMPIDSFFRSLAEDQGQNSVGIILSGTGTDGSLGIRAIKAEGGIVMVQDEQSAKYDGMPKSAIATRVADYVLPPELMAAELVRINSYVKKPFVIVAKAAQQPTESEELNRMFMLIRTTTGVDFTYYKPTTILRRIQRRMLLHKMEGLKQYVRYLQETPAEVGILYQDILINVTSFFRDPDNFITLKNTVFPRMVENKAPDTPVRVWVPGCATGEEAYSLAMCFVEFCEDQGVSHPIHVFASDIDETAVEKARQGVYPETISQDVSPERLRRFFTKMGQGYQISRTIREQCIFSIQNLIKDPPFSRMDLISCRNLMIYFGPVLQKKAIPILHYALNPSGYLMLGKSESVGEFSDLFSLVDKGSRIYSKKTATTGLRFDRERSQVIQQPEVKKKAGVPARANYDIQKEADSLILARYSPAGLVINEDMDILQFRGNISPYLKPQPGKASLNLLKMASEGLAIELRALVRQARDKDVAVRKEGIKIRQNKNVSTITIEVSAFKTHDSQERLFLVIFEDSAALTVPRGKKPERATATKDQSHEDQVEQLARELVDSQQHLKSVIAEYEASSEEFRALNEEVQSSNEELQSINEELETSKEELQSTNEELSTVNDELQNRNTELSQVNNDLLNVLSSIDSPVLLIGNELQIRRFNAAAARALNLIASDIGRPISDIRTNIIVPDLHTMIHDVIDTLKIREQEVRDRQGRWHAMAIRPYKTVDNRIDGVIVTFNDINALKLSMWSSNEAREYAEAIVETVRDALIVLNKDLHVVTANQAYRKNFRTTQEAIANKPFFELQNGVWNTPVFRELLENIRTKNSGITDFELVHEPTGGARRIFLINARAVISKDPDAHLVLLTLKDVTTRRQAEEALQIAHAELEQRTQELAVTNKELEAFSYSVSHDLKAPLRHIEGFTRNLLEDYADKLDEKGKNTLDRVVKGAAKMTRIIDDLLHLSQITRGEVQRQSLDLSTIAGSVLAELQEAQPHRRTTVDIRPGITANADAKLVELVLSNLLGNAWKFTARKENARIEFGAHEEDGKTVYSVKDNGAGFDQQYVDKLFRPFQRLHSEQEFEGVGIGLATVERVVSRHGGKIWAEGKPNEGAAFYFTLQ